MLVGVLSALLIVGLLLAVPVGLSFRIDASQSVDYRITLYWAFGLVRASFRGTGTADARRPDRATGKPRTRRTGRPRSKANVLAALRFRPFRQRLLRLAGDLWRAVHKKDLNLHLRLGLGDPADTGQLWAALGPVAGLLAAVRQASIRLEPDFLGATFELMGSGELRIVPLEILGLAAAALLSPPIWRGIRLMRVAGA